MHTLDPCCHRCASAVKGPYFKEDSRGLKSPGSWYWRCTDRACNLQIVHYKKGELPRPPAPPPLSHADARPFMRDFLTPGTIDDPLIVFTDSVTAYAGLINGTKQRPGLFGN